MKIQVPTIGPIIGYTTPNQTRIFLRGKDERQGTEFQRCFGAVRWRVADSKDWTRPIFNKLSPNFDMTGVFVLDGLSPSTKYEYQAGWFYADSELEMVQILDERQLEWPDQTDGSQMSFRTSTLDINVARSYVVGSCRYLLRLFGGAWFDDRGDKVFRSILQQIEEELHIDALLMIGDQIYADDLNFVSPDTRLDQFLERYRNVFSQENICKLMAQVPTYMILDDHEIEDNWPSKATKRDWVTLYPHAIHAYQIYQCSHSPLFSAREDGRIDGTLSHFWYQFSDGCADWFVMDSRTERKLSKSGERMISDVQMAGLLNWLIDGSGRVKFVVTSVPVFPDLSEGSEDAGDKWGAFPMQREAIVEHIYNNKIRKVVFVSGDVHCSFTSQLALASDPDFSVHSIISSSFFWPYPHMTRSDFLFGENLRGMHRKYTSELTSPVYTADNFARIDADLSEVRVTFYERKGAQLGEMIRLPLK